MCSAFRRLVQFPAGKKGDPRAPGAMARILFWRRPMTHAETLHNVLPLHGPSQRLTPEQIGGALRLGRCPTESAFDRYLPDDLQAVSSSYWTPLPVALQVARWLDELDVRILIDLGSGAGKFCIAAALASRCKFIGLEQRPRLVASARVLAELFEVQDRVHFIEGTVGELALPVPEAYYLFNPFGENLFGEEDWLDPDVELSATRYERDVAATEQLLCDAPAGTFVITYNGFGGTVPPAYQEVRVDRELPNVLRMWQKTPGPR